MNQSVALVSQPSQAAWALVDATWWLVIATFLAFAAAVCAVVWTYKQLHDNRAFEKRRVTIELITSEFAGNFISGVRYFLKNDGKFISLEESQKAFRNVEDEIPWPHEKNIAFSSVINFLAFTSSLYTTKALDKRVLFPAMAESISEVFFIMDSLIIKNIECGLNSHELVTLAKECLTYRNSQPRAFDVIPILKNYQIPEPQPPK
ncbi:MAG: DUF4760 domain-containing protein [Vulcanimicrobiaceae bacterium]